MGVPIQMTTRDPLNWLKPLTIIEILQVDRMLAKRRPCWYFLQVVKLSEAFLRGWNARFSSMREMGCAVDRKW